MNDRANAIVKACGEAITKWPPHGDVSYCNCAVNYVANAVGFDGFRGMIANEIVDLMDKSPDFTKVDSDNSQKLATDGKLVIAGLKDKPHGHVCIVIPGGEVVYSNKWRAMAPSVANVGKNNGIFGANWAFGKIAPQYFVYIEATI